MESQNKWQLAAIDGLILSSVTIIATLISGILTDAKTGMSTNFILGIVIWLAKFGGSIYLLYWLMKKYSSYYDTISYGKSFVYGFIVCMFSSIVCACFAYVSLEFIFTEQTRIGIEQTRQMMESSPAYTEQTKAMVMKIFNNYSTYVMFGQLIYLTIFGAIVSSIVSNYTKKTNPFTESQFNQEQE